MKIAVAMSGGIDSSITAIMLKEQGHEIIGITARMINTSTKSNAYRPGNEQAVEKSITDAKLIATKYNFEHYVVDLESDFDKLVIEPFCNEYLKGRTPSPCIRCNATMKFSKLLLKAQELGCEKIATGHYAQIHKSEANRYFIKQAADIKKDQSYFLFMLKQETLKNVLFPLGEYTKDQIREMAKGYGLEIANKPDSQEICFIQDNNYKAFLENYTKQTPKAGDIVNKEGKVLGKHTGISSYTIGQRRGMGIAAEKPLYVIEIDALNNKIVVGFKEDQARKGLIAKELSFMKNDNLNIEEAYVKTRSTQKPAQAKIVQIDDKQIEITFTETLDGISPGQAAVIYNENGEVLGGGWIENSF